MKSISFPDIHIADNKKISPIWNGEEFIVGDIATPLLEYSENFEGWNDTLTKLHEKNAQDNHPIDLSSRLHAQEQVRLHLPNGEGVILEIGCSSGFMLKDLKREFPKAFLIGADIVKEPLYQLAGEKLGIPILRFDVLDCPLSDASIDIIVCLNVLEHIKDDVQALKNMAKLLRPGGTLILEVPAGPHLYDASDRALKHFRRYSMPELLGKLKEAELSPVNHNHVGFFIYPAFALVKYFIKRLYPAQKSNSLDTDTSLLEKEIKYTSCSKFLSFIFNLERSLASLFSFPFGIRCQVSATRGRDGEKNSRSIY